ncbi:DUF721 domain-containing protein [Thermodesulfovibrio sp.]|uniref:DUF721 domain-containing protein n=1 Tax=Thermodesulfovibrio sp. TaxID=2067987 RepID=UPI0030965FA8
MEKLSCVIPHVIGSLGIENAIKLKFLRKKWHEIFGSPLSERTFPRDLKEGTLSVTVNSNAWLNELEFLKEDFLKSLQPYGIKNVTFKFGKIYNHNRTDKKRRVECSCSISAEQLRWIKETLSRVGDEEIKNTMESLLTKHFKCINSLSKGEKNGRA